MSDLQGEHDAIPDGASPPTEPSPVAPTELSPIAVELQQLTQRLRESGAAPEPLGVCVFATGPVVHCAETTELQCALLAGIWVAGAECPAEAGASSEGATAPPGPVEEALAQLRARAPAAATASPEALGTCVYAAGNKACSGVMSQLQCDLLGGIWFRSEAEAAGSGPG